jgi:hypothetical protein
LAASALTAIGSLRFGSGKSTSPRAVAATQATMAATNQPHKKDCKLQIADISLTNDK